MVTIVKEAIAGTLESSDVMVRISPAAGQGISLTVISVVFQQFGDEIRRVAQQTLEKLGVTDAEIYIDDKGALECTIKARIQSAILRATNSQTVEWEKL